MVVLANSTQINGQRPATSRNTMHYSKYQPSCSALGGSRSLKRCGEAVKMNRRRSRILSVKRCASSRSAFGKSSFGCDEPRHYKIVFFLRVESHSEPFGSSPIRLGITVRLLARSLHFDFRWRKAELFNAKKRPSEQCMH